MAITHHATALASANPTTSHTITIPVGTAAGDVLIYTATNRDATTDPAVSDNDSGTWLKVGGAATGHTVWWRRATAATASKTLTAASFTGSSSGVLSVFRGVTTAATPYENVSPESNISGNVSHAAIAPTRNGSWVVLCIANRTNDIATSLAIATSPAAIAERGESMSTGGSDCSATLCAAEQATAGTTGTISWTQAAGASLSLVFDLIPAPAPLVADVRGLSLAGPATGLVAARRLTAAVGPLALAGPDVTLTEGSALNNYTLAADAAALTVAGPGVALPRARRLPATVGPLSLAGLATGLLRARRLVAAAAAVVLVGNAAGLAEGSRLAAGAGAVVLSGPATGIRVGRHLSAGVAEVSLAGPGVAPKAGRRLTAAAGSVAVASSGAGLTHAPAGALSLDTTAGTLAVGGQAAGLVAHRRLAAECGPLAVAGQTTGFLASRRLPAGAGAFVGTWQAAGLNHATAGNYVLPASCGAFAVDVRPAALTYVGQPGAYTLVAACRALALASPGATLSYGFTSYGQTLITSAHDTTTHVACSFALTTIVTASDAVATLITTENTMSTYGVRDYVDMTFTFEPLNYSTGLRVPTDPSPLSVELTDPDGEIVTYTYPTAEIAKLSTGVFRFRFQAIQGGWWYAEAIGGGAAPGTSRRQRVEVSS